MDITRSRERSQNTKPTPSGTYPKEADIDAHSDTGTPLAGEKVELGDVVVVASPEGTQFEYEVVGIVEDDEKKTFAVAYSEAEDEFLVTDEFGKTLPDSGLAQEILDDFLVFAEESAQEE